MILTVLPRAHDSFSIRETLAPKSSSQFHLQSLPTSLKLYQSSSGRSSPPSAAFPSLFSAPRPFPSSPETVLTSSDSFYTVSVNGIMEIDRADGRTENQLRPLACSRNILNRAHGSASWSQGDTKVLAAVYGPKAGTKKNENPEKACIEVLWKPKTGQIGKLEKEYEMILKRTLQSICVLTINPNTTTSIIIQVVNDDGALLPCAINASCAALVDAGIPLKHLAVAICCCLAENGCITLDPTKSEEQNMKAFAYLVFPNSVLSVLPKESLLVEGEPIENGIITSVSHGVMEVDDYLRCIERGRAATSKMSDFLRKSLQSQLPGDSSKAG